MPSRETLGSHLRNLADDLAVAKRKPWFLGYFLTFLAKSALRNVMAETIRIMRSSVSAGTFDLARRKGTGPRFSVALLLAVLGCLAFAWGLPGEPIFPDETAYVTQTYFLDLLSPDTRNDWAWLEYHAYDLPPLPKYVFALAEKAAGYPIPDRRTAGRWFRNIRQSLVPPGMIYVARWPVVVFGGLGLAALYVLASLGTGDTRTGALAAVLLTIDPLYRIHAHRAMSDVPTESLLLCAAAFGLHAWQICLGNRRQAGRVLGFLVIAGLFLGLATLSKLTGFSAVIVLGALCLLALFASCVPWYQRICFPCAALIAFGVTAGLWFALNPYLTAHPKGTPPADLMGEASPDQSILERFQYMLRHRVEVSRQAQSTFPHDALPGPVDKVIAVVIQGYGRFGPLGRWDHNSMVPYPHFSWQRDFGACFWVPCVLAGFVLLSWQGLAQYRANLPPSGWAVVLWFSLTTLTVLFFIPLAWDRYYLPVQAPAIVLGSCTLVRIWEGLWGVSRSSGAAS